MYGKIFESIYEGTLGDNWRALVTFQQMIVLCDQDGVIDKTPSAISRITGIPIEIIRAGIKILEAPDANSRTPDEDGCRIRRLDEHRDWGWYLVNHKQYRDKNSIEKIRKQNRDRQRKRRELAKRNVTSRDSNAKSRHTDTDTDTDTDIKNPPIVPPSKPKPKKKPKAKPNGFIPPTLDQVKSYFTDNGYMEQAAINAFNYYAEGDPPWTDSRGNKVRSWKQKMRAVWFKPENKNSPLNADYSWMDGLKQ